MAPHDGLRIIHLTGSPVDTGWADLSRLYARAALAVLDGVDGAEHLVVDVAPDGTWSFPAALDPRALSAAERLDRADGLARLARLDADVGVPQMFCRPGLTDHRSLLGLLGIASVGNGAETMALTADKARTRAVVAAAGVDVPAATLIRRGDPLPAFRGPVVVKPVDADNSVGVTLVEHAGDLRDACDSALTHSSAVLVEDFVPLGREVRCGTVRRGDDLLALPLEEYAVDPTTKPIRTDDDKLDRDHRGELHLVAKDDEHAWIVADDDPVVPAAQAVALRAHVALDCRHHGLVDLRIDPDGRPWFLEAGPYCSFAPSSVVVTMARAAGIDVVDLFADAVAQARAASLVGVR